MKNQKVKIIVNDKEFYLGETVWVSSNSGKTFHTGIILGIRLRELDSIPIFKVKVTDEVIKNVKHPIDIPFRDYFLKVYKESEVDRIEELKEMGWRLDDIKKGYGTFVCDDSKYIIPDTIIVERIDEVNKFESDWDACRQAEKDGISFINDIDGLEKGLYIDTKENREKCIKYLQENPKYLIENLMKDESMKEYWDNYKKYFNL